MKKIILLLFFIPIIGFSQDCKFEKNEIDPFTKSKSIKMQNRCIVDAFSYGKSVCFQFIYNNNPSIYLDFSFKGIKKFKINPENNVSLLLKNQEIITINIGLEILPDINEGLGMGPNTEYKFPIKVTYEDLNKIRKIGILKIRLENSEEAQDFEVTSQSKVDKINKILDCFLNEISK